MELQLQPSCKLKTKKRPLHSFECCEGDFKGKGMKFCQYKSHNITQYSGGSRIFKRGFLKVGIAE